ncbi:MAG: hypothetical protein ACR2RE_23855, partial [Geminicoccaceae bacterium]
MLKDIPVCLYSADSGCSLHRGLLTHRIEELRKRFGALIQSHVTEDISGSFRTIAIHTHIVDYCRRQNITVVNDGITLYQKEFPEQRQIAKEY